MEDITFAQFVAKHTKYGRATEVDGFEPGSGQTMKYTGTFVTGQMERFKAKSNGESKVIVIYKDGEAVDLSEYETGDIEFYQLNVDNNPDIHDMFFIDGYENNWRAEKTFTDQIVLPWIIMIRGDGYPTSVTCWDGPVLTQGRLSGYLTDNPSPNSIHPNKWDDWEIDLYDRKRTSHTTKADRLAVAPQRSHSAMKSMDGYQTKRVVQNIMYSRTDSQYKRERQWWKEEKDRRNNESTE